MAIYRNGTWLIDANYNYIWGSNEDTVANFGTAAGSPVPGNWTESTTTTSTLKPESTQALKLNKVASYPNPVSDQNQVTFRAEGKNIQPTSLQVFTASGNQVYSTDLKQGSTHTWSLTTNRGRPISNGIYLYQIKAGGKDGATTSSQFKRLLVLR